MRGGRRRWRCALGPAHAGVAADVRDVDACRRAIRGAAVAVVCAGPFSTLGRAPARAALEEGTHYVDIADDRAYIRALHDLDAEFTRARLCAAYGCSSLPAVSSALALSLVGTGDRPARARVTLYIGGANPKGEASVRAMVERLGRTVRAADGTHSGFGDPQTIPLPPPFGPRTAYTFDGPEHDLFPPLLGVSAVDVRVGFELPLANAGFALMARTGAHWGRRTAAVLARLAALAPTIGTSGGAVLVELEWSDGRRASRALVADAGGQRMASLPCAVIAHALASGTARRRRASAHRRRRGAGAARRPGGGGDAGRERLMPSSSFSGGTATARRDWRRCGRCSIAWAPTPPFELVDLPYPGFEGRPSAAGREAFLDACARAASAVIPREDVLVYATGIGALFAVTLRARRRLGAQPLIFQGPVLWGLERRWLPRIARAGLAPLIPRLFAWPSFQRDFVRRHFVTTPTRRCTVGILRRIRVLRGRRRPLPLVRTVLVAGGREDGARAIPGVLDGIEVWWGAHDRVVGPSELRWTERALGLRWPERTFAAWGHYPMIDDPEGWVRAVVATASAGPAVRIDR